MAGSTYARTLFGTANVADYNHFFNYLGKSIVSKQTEITDIALREETILQVARIDEVTSRAAQMLASEAAIKSDLYRGIVLAKARLALRSLMSPDIMAALGALAGSKSGFLIDRPEKYTQEMLKDLLVDAMLAGLSPIGNEINLIGGNVYATKEAYERMLRDIRCSYSVQIGNATVIQGDASARYFDAAASYQWRGESGRIEFRKTEEIDTRIAVKFNATDGPDTLRGKAESKLLRRLFKHLTGHAVASLADIDDTIEAQVVSQPRVAAFDANGFPTSKEEQAAK